MVKKYIHILFVIGCLSLTSVVVKSCKSYVSYPQEAYDKAQNESPYDAIIVPGFPFENKTWSNIMKIRVLWSVHLYKKGYTKNIVYTGGAVYSPYYESKIMRLYAAKLGVPESAIVCETRAEYSAENLYYSYYLARKMGYKKIAVATDPIQTLKLMKYADKFELKVDFLPALYDTLLAMPNVHTDINPESAFEKNFVHLFEKQNIYKRWKGTRGKLVDRSVEDQ